jgi:hypothetical protein
MGTGLFPKLREGRFLIDGKMLLLNLSKHIPVISIFFLGPQSMLVSGMQLPIFLKLHFTKSEFPPSTWSEILKGLPSHMSVEIRVINPPEGLPFWACFANWINTMNLGGKFGIRDNSVRKVSWRNTMSNVDISSILLWDILPKPRQFQDAIEILPIFEFSKVN